MIDVQDTLGQLVTANPARARALEALDLDYCCEGGRSLSDACHTAGRDIEEVTAVLAEVDARTAGAKPAWVELEPSALLDQVVETHHAYLRSESPRLIELGRKVRSVHGERHPELAAVVADLEQLWAEMEPHLGEEETELFPAFQAFLGGDHSVSVDVDKLREEHDSAGALLDRLRQETSQFETPADGCASFQAFYAGLSELDADTRLHVHKENNVVFPALIPTTVGS